MKLRATYIQLGANPFIVDPREFADQFKYMEAEVPDDSDMEQMEEFAKEKVTEISEMFPLKQWKFLRLEKI